MSRFKTPKPKLHLVKKFLKASDDPVTASNLSAKREQKILLERFIKNGNTAKTRLDLADSGLNQVINVLTRFSELSIQAANDTYGVDDRLAMVKEMEELATLVLEITNTQDANGKSIFAGFKAATVHSIKNLMELLSMLEIVENTHCKFLKI